MQFLYVDLPFVHWQKACQHHMIDQQTPGYFATHLPTLLHVYHHVALHQHPDHMIARFRIQPTLVHEPLTFFQQAQLWNHYPLQTPLSLHELLDVTPVTTYLRGEANE